MRNCTFLMALIVLGCGSSMVISLDGEAFKVSSPANTIKIAENFYADESEVSNQDYRTYLYSLAQLYGRESPEFEQALPDTLVWRGQMSYGEPYTNHYFSHPAFDQYPVVGVDLDQAKHFSNWRTEQAAEALLRSKGLIKPMDNKDPEHCFSIKRYLEGDYDWIIKRTSVAFPRFSIPTIKEWEKIAGLESQLNYGVDRTTRYNKKILKRYHCLFHTDVELELSRTNTYSSRPSNRPDDVKSLSKNIYGLYGTIGNVAELVDHKNTIKGGSWFHKMEDIAIEKNEKIKKPNSWVGFRNVCKFEVMKFTDSVDSLTKK